VDSLTQHSADHDWRTAASMWLQPSLCLRTTRCHDAPRAATLAPSGVARGTGQSVGRYRRTRLHVVIWPPRTVGTRHGRHRGLGITRPKSDPNRAPPRFEWGAVTYRATVGAVPGFLVRNTSGRWTQRGRGVLRSPGDPPSRVFTALSHNVTGTAPSVTSDSPRTAPAWPRLRVGARTQKQGRRNNTDIQHGRSDAPPAAALSEG
jgi:hypothetical protein